MSESELCSDEERPLSRQERKELRALMERERRVQWFYGSIRIWASWVAGMAAAVYGVYKAMGDIGFFRKFGS
jgi:hypothetical protein